MDPRQQFIERLSADFSVAHDFFFHDRHQHDDAPFHVEMERDFHSLTPKILWMMFRGAAKSTKMEEGTTIEVAFRRVKNVIILGESETRAAERLAAIKRDFEQITELQTIFGVGPGDPWTEARACTSTGIMMQAYGRGQSLRGVKHLDARPDFILIDDVEDKESGSVSTPEARKKTRVWLTSTVIPAMDPAARIRMAATPLHPEALAPTLARADKTWVTRTYPIIYRDPSQPLGWAATWPSRFPVEWALNMRREMEEIGESESFVQEYLCQAVDPGSQTFTEDMFRVEARTRSYHNVYAVYDPARTTNKQSATTGKVVASWVGRQIIVWESDAKKWMPDEIISDIFEVNDRYNPAVIGVEENGLNEWLLQPIRTEAAKRGIVLPLRPLQAPKGKLDFIRGLQPFFRAHEITFNSDMPDLRAQLLGFPTGLIDAPNALAYMLKLRLGLPVFDNFREIYIDEGIAPWPKTQPWLLVNTTAQVTTSMLAQMQKGRLCIFGDWLAEGDAGTTLQDIVNDATIALAPPASSRGSHLGSEAQRYPLALRLMAPRHHFDTYSVYGLKPAARKLGASLSLGGDVMAGREELRAIMRRIAHGSPALAIHPNARWTLRAFAGGYARDADKQEPQDNSYRVLMEALEAFAAVLRVSGSETLDSQRNYRYTEDGRRYLSALAT